MRSSAVRNHEKVSEAPTVCRDEDSWEVRGLRFTSKGMPRWNLCPSTMVAFWVQDQYNFHQFSLFKLVRPPACSKFDFEAEMARARNQGKFSGLCGMQERGMWWWTPATVPISDGSLIAGRRAPTSYVFWERSMASRCKSMDAWAFEQG